MDVNAALLDFEEIPIIDMADATSDDPAARKRLAERIRDACMHVGFFYVKNHGIPVSLPEQAVQSSLPFFALPEEEKMKYDLHSTPNFLGYNAILSENVDPEGRGDLSEGFNFGWETLENHESEKNGVWSHDGAMGGKNIWPVGGDDMKTFRRAMLEYYHATVKLGLQLFPLLALALNLPENFFDDKTTKPAAMMRILHYPPQSGPVDGRVIGIGAHTDYEARGLKGRLPPITDFDSLGDQLARWTNDVFKSTKHRAVNRSGVRRFSIPLFFGTDYEVLIEPMASCVSPERPARYEPVKAGDYVKSRLAETYAASAHTG